jgi:hypothetical protein
LARGAPIKNDVLHWVWLALRRDATPLFEKFNIPFRREFTRCVSI